MGFLEVGSRRWASVRWAPFEVGLPKACSIKFRPPDIADFRG